MTIRPSVRQRFGLAAICAILALGGCSSLPSSGPTAHDIVTTAQSRRPDFNFRIVNLDAASIATMDAVEAKQQGTTTALSTLARDSRADLIGPGDVLAISVFEVGVSLFAGGGPREVGAGFDPSAHSENFPAVVVDGQGKIELPYLGRLTVGGLTTQDVEIMIDEGLRGKSQAPQALVTVRQNISNTVYVSGDVRKPGRMELTLGRERLLDAIAAAGGGANSAEDTVVRFARDGKIVEQRQSTIRSGTADDLVLDPGDRIELIKSPRSYVVLGATSHVTRLAFGPGGDSLIEAIAQVGGPNDASADASAIFLFRQGASMQFPGGAQPVIFRLNMKDPASYIVAQRFAIHDKDVIYIANARSNQWLKASAIFNQLFSPVAAVRAVAPNGF